MTETNERVTVDFDSQSYYLDGEYWESWDNYGEEMADKINELLNELYEEKEDWKNNCLNSVSENSILWNEISILREQGAEPSSAFQQYLDSISTEYDKFWQRKLKKARKEGVI